MSNGASLSIVRGEGGMGGFCVMGDQARGGGVGGLEGGRVGGGRAVPGPRPAARTPLSEGDANRKP